MMTKAAPFLGAMRFVDVKAMLLDGLRKNGWTVVEHLKVPHATKNDTRLWFKTQAIYMNDPNSDHRDFGNAHSLSSDMREYASVEQLLEDVSRRKAVYGR